MERGARPDVLAGHSLGELAALALGGAMSVETGLIAVAHRARALRPAHDVGGMLVLFCPVRRARALLEGLGPSSLEVAAVNLGDQTVVSGRHADLDRLAALAAHLSLASTRLESNLPFHSRLLADCVPPFAEALRGLGLSAPAAAVYSPIERAFYGPGDDLPSILASHLVRPLVFHEAMADLYELGARRFVECGGNLIWANRHGSPTPANRCNAASSIAPAGGTSTTCGTVDRMRRCSSASKPFMTLMTTTSTATPSPSPKTDTHVMNDTNARPRVAR
jgi:acyl transferase domain-containing protein